MVNDDSLNVVARYTCFTCTAGIEVCCFLGIIKITMVSNYTWKTEARTNINLSTLALLSFLFYFSSTLKPGILSLININYESHNLASCLARHGVGSRTPYPACSCTTTETTTANVQMCTTTFWLKPCMRVNFFFRKTPAAGAYLFGFAI